MSGGTAEDRKGSCTYAMESGEGSGNLVDGAFLNLTESR